MSPITRDIGTKLCIMSGQRVQWHFISHTFVLHSCTSVYVFLVVSSIDQCWNLISETVNTPRLIPDVNKDREGDSSCGENSTATETWIQSSSKDHHHQLISGRKHLVNDMKDNFLSCSPTPTSLNETTWRQENKTAASLNGCFPSVGEE